MISKENSQAIFHRALALEFKPEPVVKKKNDSEANILIICNREDKVLKFDTLFPAAKVSEKDHAAHADRLTGSLTRLKSLITARFLEQSVHWLVPRNPFFQRDI